MNILQLDVYTSSCKIRRLYQGSGFWDFKICPETNSSEFPASDFRNRVLLAENIKDWMIPLQHEINQLTLKLFL